MLLVICTIEQSIWQESEAITKERNESQMSYVKNLNLTIKFNDSRIYY